MLATRDLLGVNWLRLTAYPTSVALKTPQVDGAITVAIDYTWLSVRKILLLNNKPKYFKRLHSVQF